MYSINLIIHISQPQIYLCQYLSVSSIFIRKNQRDQIDILGSKICKHNLALLF